MKCNFSVEDIIKYTENQLSDEDNKRIREHLNYCEKCRRQYGVLNFTESYAKESSPINESIRKNVMEAIDLSRYSKDKKVLRGSIYRAMPVIKPLLAAAAVFVLVFLVASNYNNFRGMMGNSNKTGVMATDSASKPQNTDEGIVTPETTDSGIEELVDKKTITLYYGNANADGVVAEKRVVEVGKDIQIERVVFEELQKAPKTKQLHSTIPEGTKLISVVTEDGICTLDLSKEFVDNSPGGSAGESMTLCSIINSLTELPGINKVQFLIEGQKQEVYIHAVFDEPFARNEEMIKTLDESSINISGEPLDDYLKSRNEIAITAIKEKDMKMLAQLVHPVKGVLFSPYSNIDLEKNRVFTQGQISNMLKSETIYNWGAYDGSGEPIKLTFAQYYDKFVYDRDFKNAEKIAYNQLQQSGNIIVNIKDVYPEGQFYDYYFSGFNPEYSGMDWESLRLVYEKYNGQWYLVCIAHGQWTI
ncbi:GerMN domain-containing protein [Acetivibrio cellulolyticus]|uniref:GerMN domain-containing protein n=1 Tax=Acetivibrio cellulolyticus TaxID=35830 RepID=UPI0001E2E362|nr:GerMN domain-containing protein [Acetivibrio cellulolyticus]